MISLKEYIINESFDDNLKLSIKDKSKLIELDKKFLNIMKEYEQEHIHMASVVNFKEQINELITAAKENNYDFKIDLKYEKNKFSDKKYVNNLLEKLNTLNEEFRTLDCFVSKYYIYRIGKVINQIIFFNEFLTNNNFPKLKFIPSKELYDKAIEFIIDKKNKFVDKKELAKTDDDFVEKYDAYDAQKRLQKIIDDNKLEWNINVVDNMIPRMAVRPYKEFRINKKSKFSEIDLKSLEAHEIGVHVTRLHNALQCGLSIFCYGLKGSNIFDEGLAVYNSLQLSKPKPNIIFYISLKIIILYNLYKMSPVELFNFVKSLTNAPDFVISSGILRASRVYLYSSVNSLSTDADYLNGYLKVLNMTQKERDDILKYPIGPEQIYELETIKKFLKINNFEPI